MKRYSLRFKISSTIAVVVVFTVLLISFLSNLLINQQFKHYLKKEQQQKTEEIVSSLGSQYNRMTKKWNVNFVHIIGMNALYDGYIVKAYDLDGHVLWDAESCDMSTCIQVMEDITARMKNKYPRMNGAFTSETHALVQQEAAIGSVTISYFGPYFLSQNDFHFLDSLNSILVGIGIFSLAASILTGWLMAKHFSRPILETVRVAKQMSDGDYLVRMKEETDTRELAELMNSINQLADSLNQQESLRKKLTADVAHELRTPLTTLGTHLEAMIEGVWEPTSERLQSCHEEIRRISSLVQDLENLAQVESENLRLEKAPIQMALLVQRAVDAFEAVIKQKHLQIQVTGHCADVLADSRRISQVLMNLLSNAVKYTPENGQIQISLREDEGQVYVSIADNGIGILENELPFVFERFYRADKSRNRMTGGTGIGLAIVKSIINAHEGSVQVESQWNKGTIFKIILPK